MDWSLLEDFKDLTIHCDDGDVHTWKFLLLYNSEYFRTLFRSPMIKDRKSDGIVLKEISKDGLTVLIDVLMSKETITNDNLTIVYILSMRFLMNDITAKCRNCYNGWLLYNKYVDVKTPIIDELPLKKFIVNNDPEFARKLKTDINIIEFYTEEEIILYLKRNIYTSYTILFQWLTVNTDNIKDLDKFYSSIPSCDRKAMEGSMKIFNDKLVKYMNE